ncbi:MAG: YceI family protein [Cytophagaceae bacterium]
MLKYNILIGLFTGFLFNASCFAQDCKLIKEESDIKYYIRNSGIMSEGNFTDFDVQLKFNSENLKQTEVKAVIRTASVNSGIKLRDSHLKAKDFFDVQNYPDAIFVSKEIKSEEGKNTLIVIGDLTIKGITKQVTLPLTYQIRNGRYYFEGKVKINRNDFKVGYMFTLSDTAEIVLKVAAEKK